MKSLFTRRTVSGVALAAAVAVALTACASNSGSDDSSSNSISKADAAKATSAEDFGGMDGLVAAANAEGHLNLIAIPPSWANYGKIIAGFQKKYPKIKINSQNPDGSSQQEFDAIKSQQGQNTAPDVVDSGTAVLQQNLAALTPYKVANWADIPDDYKDADGTWYYDYTGVMSIGYDTTKFPDGISSLDDLLKPEFKNSVAIKGDPTKANEAASAVYMAALQSGGSADDVQKGIDFFEQLKKSGNMISTLPTQATVVSGETPVVIQWSYNNNAWGPAAGSAGNPNWKTVVLPGTALGSYYNQAVSKTAPDPAAARLWEEYIYSPEAQNQFLAAGAFPSTLAAMQSAGTVDKDALSAAGDAPSDLVQLSDDQAAAAGKLLADQWATKIG